MNWLRTLFTRLLRRRSSGWNALDYGNPPRDDRELNKLNGDV